MKIFRQRSDSDYQAHLEQCLSLDGPRGLRATAEALPKGSEDELISRAINIDFMGCAATTLFDKRPFIAPRCHFDKLEALGNSLASLNGEGIAARLRILLLYPYSTAAQIRIQAENSRKRATIEAPDYRRGDKFIEQLTYEDFMKSSLCTTSQRTLNALYDWFDQPGDQRLLLGPPNRMALRFSIFNTVVCGLRVNGRFFFDTYTYAKLNNDEMICSGDIQPVIEFTNDREDEKAYRNFCDHFRYLWRYDATLDAEDAIDRSGDFPRFREPKNIDFRHKIHRIQLQSKKELHRTQERAYRLKAQRILIKHCPSVRPSSATEEAFLACAWSAREDAPRAPNRDAVEVFRLWQRYFMCTFARSVPRIEINLMEAAPGQDLPGLLYGKLQESTIGVIILSPEIKVGENGDRYMCNPNVYHELGFLMANVQSERTFVFIEEKVSSPTNIANITWIPYKANKIALGFLNLVEGLRDVGVLGAHDANVVANGHLDYLQDVFQQGKIEAEDYRWAVDFVKGHLTIELV